MNKQNLHSILLRYTTSPNGLESQQKFALDIQKHIQTYGRCKYIIIIEEEFSKFLISGLIKEEVFKEFLKKLDKLIQYDNS